MLWNEISIADFEWRALWTRVLITALMGGLIALALEPDHTSGMPVLAAFGLWSSHILIAATLFVASLVVFLKLRFSDRLSTIFSTLLLPATFAPFSLALDYGFGKPDEELLTNTGPVTVYLSEIIAIVPFVLSVAAIMAFLIYRHALNYNDASVEDRSDTASAPSLNSLINAIPRSLGNDIIRMYAQDHYVKIVTVEGSALLTERFSVCVEKLALLDGIQCHRSHWISLDHVKNFTRSGSAYVSILDNGEQVPVSRRRYTELKGRIR